MASVFALVAVLVIVVTVEFGDDFFRFLNHERYYNKKSTHAQDKKAPR